MLNLFHFSSCVVGVFVLYEFSPMVVQYTESRRWVLDTSLLPRRPQNDAAGSRACAPPYKKISFSYSYSSINRRLRHDWGRVRWTLSAISHFRVPPGLCIKTRLSAQPLIWRWFVILMQIKLIFTRKVVPAFSHFESERFWNSEVA